MDEIKYDPNKAHYLTATAVIIKDGKYLITRRSENEKVFPGLWTVPGGKLEVSDYISLPKDTSEHWYNIVEKILSREIMEETNLKVKNYRYLTSLSFIRPDKIPGLILSFYAEFDAGDLKLCDDLTEHAWVSLLEAGKYELIEGIFEEIEMLDKILKGGHQSEWSAGDKYKSS
jgi:8-oxo-dGTP pyrophosphatase MutT (NUDIX family)